MRLQPRGRSIVPVPPWRKTRQIRRVLPRNSSSRGDLVARHQFQRTLGLSLPSTAVAQQLFSSCTAHGGKGWDHSAMVRALELMAGHEIATA